MYFQLQHFSFYIPSSRVMKQENSMNLQRKIFIGRYNISFIAGQYTFQIYSDISNQATTW